MTRIKQTFSSKQTKDPEQILFEHQQQHQQEELLSALKQEEVITATSNLSSSSSLVQGEDNEEEEDPVDDEDNALEQRLLRQVTEMFSKSMFLYSNSCGNYKQIASVLA